MAVSERPDGLGFEGAANRMRLATSRYERVRSRLLKAVEGCETAGVATGLAADARQLLVRLEADRTLHQDKRTYSVLASFGQKGASHRSRRLAEVVQHLEKTLALHSRLLEERLPRLAKVLEVVGEIEMAGARVGDEALRELRTLAGRSPEVALVIVRGKVRSHEARAAATSSLVDSLACRRRYLESWVTDAIGDRPEGALLKGQIDDMPVDGQSPEDLLAAHTYLDSASRRIGRHSEQRLKALVKRTCERTMKDYSARLSSAWLSYRRRVTLKRGLRHLREAGLKQPLPTSGQGLDDLRAFWEHAAKELLGRE